MVSLCSRRSPLTRSGLTQTGRRRSELGADHFGIDERDIADLIMFGRRYAKHIRFYEKPREAGEPPLEAIADWTRFFENDLSSSLAALAKLPVESMASFQSDLEVWLKAEPPRDPAMLGAYFKLFFHLPFALLSEAGSIAEKLPQNEPLRAQVSEIARRELAKPIEALIGWYKGATAPGPTQLFVDGPVAEADYKLGPVASDNRLRLPAKIQSTLIGRKGLGSEPLPSILLADIAPGKWDGIWARVVADDAPYRDGGAKAYERIYDALDYNLMASAIRSVTRVAARIKQEANDGLMASLERLGSHDPHYGLWLTFLRLFRHAQQSLNGFTERHLDFYFREVLQLRPREAAPDHVHLLFELAKSVDAVKLSAGTAFRAGNDALGRAVAYALEQDLIVNRGRIAALSGLRLEAAEGGVVALASTELRSSDGMGKKPLPPERLHWPAFGPAEAAKARIGFAVADRKLFLREGARTIKVLAAFAKRLPVLPASDSWRVRLTGPEGWWEPPAGLSVTIHEDEPVGMPDRLRYIDGGYGRFWKGARTKPRLEFKLELDADAPPIVPYDSALHGGNEENNGLPCMEISFDFGRSSAAASYAGLGLARLTSLEIEVSASGLKQLSLVAGGATVDPAKPFAPFGPHPRAGAALIIGSSEIFSKPIASLTLGLDWQEQYQANRYFRLKQPAEYQVSEAILKLGSWKAGASHPLFDAGQSVTISFHGASLIDGDGVQTLANPDLSASSVSGFARLSLSADFGHAEYPAEYARSLVKLAKDDGADLPQFFQLMHAVPTAQMRLRDDVTRISGIRRFNDQPNTPLPPYDPMVTRIEAGYRSRLGPVERFIHLLPFGEVDAKADEGRLFPVLDFSGALMIGVADFQPPARLSLLVEVADGSGDPLKRPPRLFFDYLAGDNWKPFEEGAVDDKTAGFTTSGLLGLAVPTDADRRHRAMPDGLHWFRISVDADADALNRLLSIDAQAGRAIFVDSGNDRGWLATPLPAGSIAKFVEPDPRVKKLNQPYNSFGGRPPECSEDFATRVSERLRHKGRAVAAFDYEALILEAFPKLYRAKCLPTTAMVRDDGRRIIADNEVAPGAVSVVTIPFTHGVNSRNPLRPYADQAVLGEVERYLKARVSPFVRLEVMNPKFEEVQASFKVRFHAGIADIAFHRDELNEALVRFLTPWAREDGGDIMFGGKLWKSSLIDFVEERPEVDFVTDFKLFHKPDSDVPEGRWTPVDIELVEATTARSILVSASRHLIEEVPAGA